MDFQPTAQPLVAGGGVWLVAESPTRSGLGRAGGDGGGRRKPVRGGLAAASMPRTPPSSPPARPLTHSGGSARHGKKKEEQEQKRHSGCPAPLRSDRSHPRMAWIYRVDQGRHLPRIGIYPPSPGNCRGWGGVGWQDRWRHGWRHRAPMDGFTACPANPHRPAQPAETQSRFGSCTCTCLKKAVQPQAAKLPQS